MKCSTFHTFKLYNVFILLVVSRFGLYLITLKQRLPEPRLLKKCAGTALLKSIVSTAYLSAVSILLK